MRDYLILCLDACRYDTFREAKTPNFDKIGSLKKAHSISGYTPSTITATFMNLPPYDTGKKKFLDAFPKTHWLPEELKKKGYYTAFLTANAIILLHRRIFGRSFDELKGLEFNHSYAADRIIDRNIEIFKMDKPKFIFNLFMATHTPYSDGKSNLPLERTSQVKALEAVDRQFGRLLPKLRNVEVIIFSDHGDLCGEQECWGHSPDGVVFHEKVFEIPFIQGYYKRS